MTEHAFLRPQAKILASRLEEPRRFIQAIAGPRQVGKTTLVRQVLRGVTDSTHYASADEPTLRGPGWIELQWEVARTLASDHSQGGSVLVLDEIQKLQEWPETVKRLWDEDSATGRNVKVVLLGSSPLLVQRRLGESLAGRFELLHLPHWSYPEMRAAFGWSLEQFLYFGGYPGAAPLVLEPERWARYIINSLVETTISRDLFLLKRVDKPALFRRLFYLGCSYSGQVLSYNKMLGQLQEAGNTTTLAHYLDLLSGAGMVAGLPKYASGAVRQRGSSPKLLVYNTALLTSQSGLSTEEARADPVFWGHLVESAIG
ncbi:MAG: AAA family ATPase, partial [bacterium]